MAQLAGLADGTAARTLVRKLNRIYDVEGCAFRVVEVAGGFQLMTRPQFAPWLRRLHALPVEVRLSAPALETLAVVAYRQPVLRAAIEAVRGVQCGEILRQLMERDLVRMVGRSEELGRPILYGTTRRFLQVFGLRHLDELPRPDLVERPEPSRNNRATTEQGDSDQDLSNQLHSNKTEGETNVKTLPEIEIVPENTHPPTAVTMMARPKKRDEEEGGVQGFDDDEGLDDGVDDDEDLDDDEDEDFEDDEDLEDEEWEEVDDEEEEEEWEEEEEDEEWEEEEDEDWEEDEEDDDEDEEWEEEDEGEDWG